MPGVPERVKYRYQITSGKINHPIGQLSQPVNIRMVGRRLQHGKMKPLVLLQWT